MSGLLTRENVHKIFRRLGLEVHRVGGRPSEVPLPLPHVVRLLARENIDLVLDVGANIGQFAYDLRRSGYRGRIVSFEPLSAAHQKLSAWAAADTALTVAPRMALGAEEGEIEINLSDFSEASSVLPASKPLLEMFPQSAASAKETVPCHRLDSVAEEYFGPGERALLKVDVQGFEKQVLEGAESLLPRIGAIAVELSVVALYDGQALASEILEYVRGWGFEIWYMTPGFLDPHSGQMLQYDVLMARTADRVAK